MTQYALHLHVGKDENLNIDLAPSSNLITIVSVMAYEDKLCR